MDLNCLNRRLELVLNVLKKESVLNVLKKELVLNDLINKANLHDFLQNKYLDYRCRLYLSNNYLEAFLIYYIANYKSK